MTIALVILALLTAALTLHAVRSAGQIAEERRKASTAEERAELYRQQLAELKAQTDRDTERFRNMATEIFTTQSERLRHTNEQRLSELLTPLSDNIREFKKAVNESYTAEARERFALDGRIRELIEANRMSSRETHGQKRHTF